MPATLAMGIAQIANLDRGKLPAPPAAVRRKQSGLPGWKDWVRGGEGLPRTGGKWTT